MANTKISQLPANNNPSGGEELVYAYNNTNGKMTLNTMKGYVEDNLSGYATTSDLTTGLATKQDELVSATNIKTINGSSVLGSGDLIVTGGTAYSAGTGIDITSGTISNTGVTSVNGQTGAVTVSGGGEENDYDCVVDYNGTGDYTTIGDAITAGKKKIFVKNGNYTMSAGTLSTGDFKLVGESKNGVHLNIIYGTRSGTIFNLTSDAVSISNSFLFSNVTFNITYTGEFGYFIMFGGMGNNGFLTMRSCNIIVASAVNGCNFYITSGSHDDTLIESCYIEVYPATGSFTNLGFLGVSRYSTCISSTIVVDTLNSLSQSITFNTNMDGVYIGCKIVTGKTHATSGDIVIMGGTNSIRCVYQTSTYANYRIYGTHLNCSFPALGKDANYDSALATAVTNKSITIWKPNTSYTVGQYVQSGYNLTLAKCITAHTSGDTFDNTKFEDVYGDVYISGTLRNCDITVWGTVVLSGLGQYSTAYTVPSMMGTFRDTSVRFDKPSSSLSNNANFVVLGYRGVEGCGFYGDNLSALHIYLAGEGSTFVGNRIVHYTGDIYSGGYGNVIVGNTFTYVTGQTTPTITQVTSGLSEIANNAIRGIADWN